MANPFLWRRYKAKITPHSFTVQPFESFARRSWKMESSHGRLVIYSEDAVSNCAIQWEVGGETRVFSVDWVCNCTEKQNKSSQKQGAQESQSVCSSEEIPQTDGRKEQDIKARRKPSYNAENSECLQILQGVPPVHEDTSQNRRWNHTHDAWSQWSHKWIRWETRIKS